MADISNLSPSEAKQILDDLKNTINSISLNNLSGDMQTVLSTMQQTVNSTKDLSIALDSVSDAQQEINIRLTKYERKIKAGIPLLGQEQDEYLKLLDISEQLSKSELERNRILRENTKALQKQSATLGVIKNITDAIVKVVGQSATKWLEIDELSKSTAKAMGMNAKESMAYHKALSQTTKELAVDYGLTVKEANELQNAYSNASGKARLLTKEQMTYSASLNNLVGNDVLSSVFENMDNLGSDADAATGALSKAWSKASKLGLNAAKTSKEFAKNLSMANRYNFKNGVDGIMKMTMLSQKLKFNLDSMGGMIDKFSNIDSAIETSAKMQVLGGSFAQAFGNPLEAMSMALMNPEELINKFTKMVEGKGVFDEKTGQVKIDPMQRMMLKQAAENLGINFDDVMNATNATARNSHIEKQFQGDLNEDQKVALLNKAQWDAKTGKAFIVTHDENGFERKTNVEDIHANDGIIAELLKQEEPVEDIRKHVAEISKALVSDKERIEGVKEQRDIAMSQTLDPLFRKLEDFGLKFANSDLWKLLTDGSMGTGGMMLGLIGWDILKTVILKGGNILFSALKGLAKGITATGKFIWNAGSKIMSSAAGKALGALAVVDIRRQLQDSGIIKKGSSADAAVNISSKTLAGYMVGGPVGAAVGAALSTLQSARDAWGKTLKDEHKARMKSSNFMDKYLGTFEQLGVTILDLGGDLADTVDKTVGALSKGFSEGFSQILNGDFAEGFKTMGYGILESGKELFSGLWETLKNLGNNLWEYSKNMFDTFIITPFNAVTDGIKKGFDWVTEKIYAFGNGMLEVVDGIKNFFAHPVDTVKSWFGGNTTQATTDNTAHADGHISLPNEAPITKAYMKEQSMSGGNARLGVFNTNESIVGNDILAQMMSAINPSNSLISPIPTVGQKVNIAPTQGLNQPMQSSLKDINLNINGTLRLDGSMLGNKQVDLDLSSLFNDPRVKAQLIDMVREEFTKVNGKQIKDSRFYKLGNMSGFAGNNI